MADGVSCRARGLGVLYHPPSRFALRRDGFAPWRDHRAVWVPRDTPRGVLGVWYERRPVEAGCQTSARIRPRPGRLVWYSCGPTGHCDVSAAPTRASIRAHAPPGPRCHCHPVPHRPRHRRRAHAGRSPAAAGAPGHDRKLARQRGVGTLEGATGLQDDARELVDHRGRRAPRDCRAAVPGRSSRTR